MHVLGIDVGGSGIKGAPVDTNTGKLLADRIRHLTPKPATPEAMIDVMHQLIREFNWEGPVGVGFPAVVQQGIVRTASNIDQSWIGKHVETLLSLKSNCPSFGVNDADAAGMAEMSFGAGVKKGVCILVTVGTGVGTAFFTDGRLLPNTELGHLPFKGKIAEKLVSDAAKKRGDLSWKDWSKLFSEYLNELERLFWPDLIILGGGICKKFDKFEKMLAIKTPLVTATLENEAGIVGAALYARQQLEF